jgi:hypothetical protein
VLRYILLDEHFLSDCLCDEHVAMRARTRPIPPDPTTPDGWLAIHRAHGRPFYETKIGVWHQWRCTCGVKFHFTDEQRDRAPGKYTLGNECATDERLRR